MSVPHLWGGHPFSYTCYFSTVTNIIAVAPVLADNVYEQSVITDELAPLVTSDRSKQAVMRRLHSSSKIATRHTILPLESYRDLNSFTQANDLFITAGTDLAERAIRLALQKSKLVASDIDFFFFTSVTGIAAPSLDAILASRLGMRSDVKRVPSFGLGCVAGASALARVHDYLTGHPTEIALIVSLELCSLTIQRDDSSMANLVASGLFGDGATAVILAGDARDLELDGACPQIIATGSRLYSETSDVIGWNVGSSGFRIVLSAGVPALLNDISRTTLRIFSSHSGSLCTMFPSGWLMPAVQRSLKRSRPAWISTRVNCIEVGPPSVAWEICLRPLSCTCWVTPSKLRMRLLVHTDSFSRSVQECVRRLF